jgi:hypothetical protein
MTNKTDYRAREYAKRVEVLRRRKARAEKYGHPVTRRVKAGAR